MGACKPARGPRVNPVLLFADASVAGYGLPTSGFRTMKFG
jgi:hypothetical protein